MKKTIVSLVILMAAGQANAAPGSWGLTCFAHRGTAKEIKIDAGAANIEGTQSGFPSEVSLVLSGKAHGEKLDDGTLAGLQNTNHVRDGVLAVKYRGEENAMGFEVWALPAKIKLDKSSTEYEGHLTFKGKGYVYVEGEGYQDVNFNCSYTFTSGSAG